MPIPSTIYADGDFTTFEQVDGKRPCFPFLESPNPDRYAKCTERDIMGATGSYVSRVPVKNAYTNLLTFSEQIDNAAWTKTNTTITANATTAPDGQLTMDFVKETSATAAHEVTHAGTVTASACNLSVFAAPAGRNFLRLLFTDSGATSYSAFFDLSLGRVFSIGAGATAAIQAYDDGNFRCSIQFTPAAGAGTVKATISTDGSTTSYAGNTALGIYLWGADLKNAASAGPYIATTNATRAVSAPDVDVDDALQYLVAETTPRMAEATLIQVTQTFARIPAAQTTYSNYAFSRPVMDDIKSGSHWAVTLDKGVTSTIFSARKTVAVVGAITLATQTTTNNAPVFNARASACDVTAKIGSTTATVQFTGSAATIQAAWATAFSTTVTCVASDNTVSLTTTGTVISCNMNTAGFTLTLSGSTITVAAASVSATSVISPATNQSYRSFNIVGHGMTAGQLIAFWLGDRVVARSYVLVVVDADNIRVPLADVNGTDFIADSAATAGTRYINGLKYCSSRLTQTFYLAGVTVGINSPTDIPQPDVIMSAQGWMDAIVGAGAYGSVQVSSLASWKGSIYAQEVTDIEMADAIETI